ncbi:hypothetical protein HMI48_05400 [Acidithiobacillus ferrooxidans]|nr:hypothetical protein [Acidithiobacillus ferrooxidans]
MTHEELVNRAKSWLKGKGCGVILGEPFRARTTSKEIPDAIGWFGDATSILVECKASRSDFLADANKRFRKETDLGVGQWRFYLCPPDIIEVADLPEHWGLLWSVGRSVKTVHGVPGNCHWRTHAPFRSNRLTEAEMLSQALRRVVIRGHLNDVYDPITKFDYQGVD